MGLAEEGAEEYDYGEGSLEQLLFRFYDSFKEL
jgi:hypothetical protein